MKNTLGPSTNWHVEDWCIYGHNSRSELVRVADFSPADGDKLANGEVDSNIKLAAAAPELLAALEAIIAESDGGWLRESPIAKQASAAIAKAEGTT